MVGSEVWYSVVTSRDAPDDPPLRVSDHPFLRGMSPEWVEAVGKGSVDVTYEPGELLFRDGEVADRFFLIFHGLVTVELREPGGRPRAIQTIGPGDVLDWSGIVPPYVWRFDGRAVKETRVVSLNSSALRRSLDTHPADGVRFLRRLLPLIGQRAENARAQLGELRE